MALRLSQAAPSCRRRLALSDTAWILGFCRHVGMTENMCMSHMSGQGTGSTANHL